MSDSAQIQFSMLLTKIRLGSEEAKAQLIQQVYPDLCRLAQNYLKRERSNQSLEAAALVHEVYLRLFGENKIDWQERSQFFIVAARQMRRILIDYARAAAAAKYNGGGQIIPLDEATQLPSTDIEVMELNEALRSFEKLHFRASRVVKLRYFVGLTEEEIANALGVSVTTVKREWKFARLWLYDHIRGPIRPV